MLFVVDYYLAGDLLYIEDILESMYSMMSMHMAREESVLSLYLGRQMSCKVLCVLYNPEQISTVTLADIS